VSAVRKRDRSGVTEEGQVGLTVWDARPVVIAVDQGHGGSDATVKFSGGDHAVHVAEDFACHARIVVTTADPTQLGDLR
jgi:hypothetical protein